MIAEKYDTTPFDPNDPRDIRSEKARCTVIDAFLACDGMIETGDDLKDVASGLFFGIVSILAAHTELTDENHAALRAGLLQMIPYSVDLFRSTIDLPPLADDTARNTDQGTNSE